MYNITYQYIKLVTTIKTLRSCEKTGHNDQ